LMRMPGSIAWPWKPERVPEVTELRRPAEARSYPVHGLSALLPREQQDEPQQQSETASSGFGLNTPRMLIEKIKAGNGGWHNSMIALVGHWTNRGWTDAEILTACEAFTLSGYTVQQTRAEVAKAIEGARKKWNLPDREEPIAGTASTYRLLTADDVVNMPPVKWLVPGLLPENSFAVLYGLPGSLKSFVVLDFALRLAFAMPWLGKHLAPRDVLYIAGEGAGSFGKRIEAWRELNGVMDRSNRFRLLPQSVNLMDQADLQRLVQTVKEAAEGGFRPSLIVADTLARCMPGADENSARDMGLAVNAGARLQTELGATFLPVHHCGKDPERGLRGSNALLAASDTTLKITRTGDRVSLLVERQKDDEDGLTYHLKAEKTDLPPRSGIAGRSSLVMVPDLNPPDAEAEGAAPGKRGHVRPSVELFHRALLDALAVMSIRPGVTTCAAWESEATRKGLVDPIEPEDSSAEKGRKRAKFRAAKSDLLAARWIAINHHEVWDLTRPW